MYPILFKSMKNMFGIPKEKSMKNITLSEI